MKLPRFRVATVTGYPITGERHSRPSGHLKPGLSAHVLDSLHGYALVASYRSEDRFARGSNQGMGAGRRTRGHDRTLLAAQEHADRLNAIHRTETHREVVRRSRG